MKLRLHLSSTIMNVQLFVCNSLRHYVHKILAPKKFGPSSRIVRQDLDGRLRGDGSGRFPEISVSPTPGDSRYPKLLITLHPSRARYRAWVSHYHVNIVV